MARPHTHYDNLKVARNAPTEVIRAAYRALAQKYHPDVNPTPDAARVMQILNNSWSVLSDPKRRAEHDRWISEQENQTHSSGPASRSTSSSRDADPTYTYTYTQAKPPPSEAQRTRRQSSAQSAESSQHSAPGNRKSYKQPTTTPDRVGALRRFNVWLGTSNGKTYATTAVVIIIAWLWLEMSNEATGPRLLERPSSQQAYEPPQEHPAHIAPPTAQSPISPSATELPAEGGRGFRPIEKVKETKDLVPQFKFIPVEDTTRWSPNGKPWPATASYLKGMPHRATGGLSQLTVDNTSGGSDVYVKLCSVELEKCSGYRHVFIPQGSSFTMKGVAPGTYDIRYRNLSSGYLAKSEPISLQQVQEEQGTRYSAVRLTLYTVAAGNMKFTPLPEDQF